MVPMPEIESTTHCTKQRILVVDDEPNVLVIVGAFLTKAGFAVGKSSDSDEAMRMVAGDPHIDVLVTDFAMPGMSGAELISEAKRLQPDLKAVIMTGYPDASALEELPPGTPILVKPFRRVDLIDEIQSLLAEAESVSV
jgi:DNA-binding NtrC family response regulator